MPLNAVKCRYVVAKRRSLRTGLNPHKTRFSTLIMSRKPRLISHPATLNG